MQDLEEFIRERAYQLWIADGRPDGNADGYWLNAQRELLAASLDGPIAETALPAVLDAASVAMKPKKTAKVVRSRTSKRSAA